MTYILAYILISFCTYMLMKNWLYKLTEPIGGFYNGIQELFEQMDKEEIEKGGFADETWKLADENTMLAVLHTLFLVINLVIWPIVLAALLYWMYTGATWDGLVYEKPDLREGENE